MPIRSAAATLEVALAFGVVHVTFRALKHFTVVGEWERAAQTNFTPGAVMALFTFVILLLCRRSPRAYGITLKPWRENLSFGLAACCLLAAAAGIGLALTRIQFDASRPAGMHRALPGAVVALLVTAALVWLLRRHSSVLRGIPPIISVIVMLAVLCAPIVSHPERFLTVLWLFLAAGFGEEIFFFGYIQSRVTQTSASPWCGIIVASLFFGFLHVLNTVDYFHGRFNFAWWYGLQSFCVGLFHGVLRHHSGSILPGAIAHGLGDILARFPIWFRFQA